MYANRGSAYVLLVTVAVFSSPRMVRLASARVYVLEFERLLAEKPTLKARLVPLIVGVGVYSSASQKLGFVIGSQSAGAGGAVISNFASALEIGRVDNGNNNITMQLSAQDSNSSNSVNVEIVPRGSGFFTVGGQGAVFTDNITQFAATNGRKARFNCDTLNSGGDATKVFNFPGGVTSSDTLLTENAAQTFTNKTGLFVGDSDAASTPSSISAGLRVVNSQSNRTAQFVVGHWTYTGTITYRPVSYTHLTLPTNREV